MPNIPRTVGMNSKKQFEPQDTQKSTSFVKRKEVVTNSEKTNCTTKPCAAAAVAAAAVTRASGVGLKPNIITVIGPHDILLGRGSISIGNEGNIRFRELIQSRKDDYVTTSRRRKKDVISKEIATDIATRGGRFLRKVDDAKEAQALGITSAQIETAWVEATEDIILKKIKQSLRDLDRENFDEKSDNDDASNNKKSLDLKRSCECSEKTESIVAKRPKQATTVASAAKGSVASPDEKRKTGILVKEGTNQKQEQSAQPIPTRQQHISNNNNEVLPSQLIPEDKRRALLQFIQKEKITPALAAAVLREEQDKANSLISECSSRPPPSQEGQAFINERSPELSHNSDNQEALPISRRNLQVPPSFVTNQQQIQDLRGSSTEDIGMLSEFQYLINQRRLQGLGGNYLDLLGRPADPQLLQLSIANGRLNQHVLNSFDPTISLLQPSHQYHNQNFLSPEHRDFNILEYLQYQQQRQQLRPGGAGHLDDNFRQNIEPPTQSSLQHLPSRELDNNDNKKPPAL